MNLFNQVGAFSRGRYAAHLFTNGIHGEEMVMVELLLLLFLLAMRHMRREHIRKMSKNADNEQSLGGGQRFTPAHQYIVCDILLLAS